jgi:hypothetical protein
MSEPIKVGDLVYVLKTCCPEGTAKMTGRIRTVSAIQNERTKCPYCGNVYEGPHINNTQSKVAWGSPHWWFRRIPPTGELDDVKRDEEITA